MPQSTMSSLIKRPYRWSPYLPSLARELQTTIEYLVGEIDDPATGAPLPLREPIIQHVTLPVALPSEAALTAMFAGLLAASRRLDEDGRARELAKRLPKALGALQGQLIEQPLAQPDEEPAPAEAPPNNRRARRQASST
jgi:hypothetical protein